MTPVLEVRGLVHSYNGQRPILRNVSFTVNPGERLGVVGGNGAGKSTLLWCLLGLHHYQGSVRVFGQPVRSVRNRIGVVFQNPEDLLFMPELLQDLTLPLLNRGADASTADRKAREALELMDLGPYAAMPASHLSLGQRKRAAIAAALVSAPDLLLLDEPTAELDGRSVRRLTEHLLRIPIPYLITSHDLDLLESVASRLIVLIDGAVAADAASAEILSDRELLDRASLI